MQEALTHGQSVTCARQFQRAAQPPETPLKSTAAWRGFYPPNQLFLHSFLTLREVN